MMNKVLKIALMRLRHSTKSPTGADMQQSFASGVSVLLNTLYN